MKLVLLGTALTLVFVVASYQGKSAAESGDQKTIEVENLAAQMRDLKKQIMETPRIVAAGLAASKA